jgi:hypothetical protein
VPLNTLIENDGITQRYDWDEEGLNMFLTVGLWEGDPRFEWRPGKTVSHWKPPNFLNVALTGVYYLGTKAKLWKHGRQILKKDYTFELPDRTVMFKKGMVLKMWRT